MLFRSIHGDMTDTMIGKECGLAGMHAAIVRNRLRTRLSRMPDDSHATRTRLIALDESLLRQRAEQVAHRLRRLDAKLSRDLPDARLVRVLREEVDEEVIYPSLERRQRLRHAPPALLGFRVSNRRNTRLEETVALMYMSGGLWTRDQGRNRVRTLGLATGSRPRAVTPAQCQQRRVQTRQRLGAAEEDQHLENPWTGTRTRERDEIGRAHV